MDRWRALFDDYRLYEAEQLEAERRALELAAARRDFQAWCRAAVEYVLAELFAVAERRSDELAEHAGVRVRIKPPRVAAYRERPAEIGYVELARREDIVYVYSYHELGHAPFVHHMLPIHAGPPASSRHPRHARMLSLPGARIERASDDSVVLAKIALDGSAVTDAVTSIDDLAFRAFELLLRGRYVERATRFVPPEPGADTAILGSPMARS